MGFHQITLNKTWAKEALFQKIRQRFVLSQDMAVRVLDESVGKIVLIKLKGGKVIRGNLQGFDQHMNLLLENSEEIVEEGKSSSLGTIVVRGDNVVIISPPPKG